MNPIVIQSLLVVLLIVAIAAVGRLFFVLGDVRRVLGNVETTLETTRKDVDATLTRLNSVAESTDKVLREEVAPTLHVMRETLSHVEVTTRVLAETSMVAKQIAGRVETLVTAQKLAATGGAVAQFVAKKSAGAAISLLAGVGAGVRGLWTRRHSKPSTELIEAPKPTQNAVIVEKNGSMEPENRRAKVGSGTGKRS